MTCTKAQLLVLLNKIRKELRCKEDKALLDLYIDKIESLAEGELEAELWH